MAKKATKSTKSSKTMPMMDMGKMPMKGNMPKDMPKGKQMPKKGGGKCGKGK